MPGRLEELRRQRALQKEHLDWLDREIAALEGTATPDLGDSPPFLGAPQVDNRDAEAILAEYRQPTAHVAQSAKRGCLLYFGIAIALIAIALIALYLEVKARRGH